MGQGGSLLSLASQPLLRNKQCAPARGAASTPASPVPLPPYLEAITRAKLLAEGSLASALFSASSTEQAEGMAFTGKGAPDGVLPIRARSVIGRSATPVLPQASVNTLTRKYGSEYQDSTPLSLGMHGPQHLRRYQIRQGQRWCARHVKETGQEAVPL